MKKHARKVIQTRGLRALPCAELSRVEGAGIGTSPSVDNTVPCIGVKSVVPCVGVKGVQPCVG
jgi:hypothetical protein